MTRTSTFLAIAFALGFMVALTTVSGCSEAANRTLKIFQLQSTETYTGAFRIDTSGLPPDAIESKTETGGPGKPVTQITLNMDYEIEVVLRIAGERQSNDAQTGKSDASTNGN